MNGVGYTELYHPKTHGFNELSYQEIDGHFISVLRIKNPIEYLTLLSLVEKMDFDKYYDYITLHNSKSLNNHREILFHIKMRKCVPHENIRNFEKIQEQLLHPSSLQIMQINNLPSGERICILKTFWLKCIQRKWKKICKYNATLLDEMKKLKNLHKRELMYISNKMIGLNGLWYVKI